MFSFESHLAFPWKMQTSRTWKNSRGRHNHNQMKQRKTLVSHTRPSARKPRVQCLRKWATARWENTISKCMWENANGNGSHWISASISRCRAMILFLGSIWTISFTSGHYIWERGQCQVWARPGQVGQEPGRWVLVYRESLKTEGRCSLRLGSWGLWLCTLEKHGNVKHGNGLCVTGGHRSKMDRAHRRAGLGELWEIASKHVEPPTTESNTLWGLQANAAFLS